MSQPGCDPLLAIFNLYPDLIESIGSLVHDMCDCARYIPVEFLFVSEERLTFKCCQHDGYTLLTVQVLLFK